MPVLTPMGTIITAPFLRDAEGCLLQALREVEREKARQQLGDAKSIDMEYLKNIMLKLFEKGALRCRASR